MSECVRVPTWKEYQNQTNSNRIDRRKETRCEQNGTGRGTFCKHHNQFRFSVTDNRSKYEHEHPILITQMYEHPSRKQRKERSKQNQEEQKKTNTNWLSERKYTELCIVKLTIWTRLRLKDWSTLIFQGCELWEKRIFGFWLWEYKSWFPNQMTRKTLSKILVRLDLTSYQKIYIFIANPLSAKRWVFITHEHTHGVFEFRMSSVVYELFPTLFSCSSFILSLKSHRKCMLPPLPSPLLPSFPSIWKMLFVTIAIWKCWMRTHREWNGNMIWQGDGSARARY